MAATFLATTSFAAFADGVTIGGGLVITIPTPTDTPVYLPIGTTIDGVTPLSGNMVFEYAQPALNMWDFGVISGFRPVSADELLTTFDSFGGFSRIALTTQTDTISVGSVSHEIKRITTTGGLYQVAAPTPNINRGGTLSLTNWGYDATKQTIFADVLALGGGEFVDAMQVPIWVAGQSSQVIDVQPNGDGESIHYSIKLDALTLTDMGRRSFTVGLGLERFGVGLLNTAEGQWGSATFTTQLSAPTGYFAATVPEPETYVLMALGLIGVTAAVRRRQAH